MDEPELSREQLNALQQQHGSPSVSGMLPSVSHTGAGVIALPFLAVGAEALFNRQSVFSVIDAAFNATLAEIVTLSLSFVGIFTAIIVGAEIVISIASIAAGGMQYEPSKLAIGIAGVLHIGLSVTLAYVVLTSVSFVSGFVLAYFGIMYVVIIAVKLVPVIPSIFMA
mgnify:CR=1 FL=1